MRFLARIGLAMKATGMKKQIWPIARVSVHSALSS
jgi:hypothetical protein